MPEGLSYEGIFGQDRAQFVSPASIPLAMGGARGYGGGVPGGVPGGVAAPLSPPPPPRPPAARAQMREAVKVGGIIMESRVIKKMEPAYPDLAKRARIQGNVILVLNIDEEGNVSDVKVQSGHPLLNDAAIAAAKQWKYSPVLLNGEPVAVMATATVVFNLDGSSGPQLGQSRIDVAVAQAIANLKAGKPADNKTFIREGKAEVELSVNSRSEAVVAKLRSLGFEVISLTKAPSPIIGRIAVEKLKLLLDIDAVLYIAPHRR
jgi:TonB family protein